MIERLRQILIKEFIHLFRDPHARFSLIVPPLLQMLIFGYAASLRGESRFDRGARLRSQPGEPRVPRSLQRQQPLPGARRPAQRIANPSLLDHRRVVLVLQIQPGFAELLRKGQTAPVQAVLDGTDSNTALIAVGYINQIASAIRADYQLQLADRMRPSLATFAPSIELAGTSVVQREPREPMVLRARRDRHPGAGIGDDS